MIDIRPIEQGDVPACRAIVAANWSLPIANRFTMEVSNVWADMIEPPCYYVAVDEWGVVAGFAGMQRSWIMRGAWQWTWINVRHDRHGEGIGRKLVDYRIEEVKRASGVLIHLVTRIPAYFEPWGFRTIRDFGTWEMMEKQLGEVTL